MSEFLSQVFTEQYSTNLQLKLQQTQSKLRGKVMEGQHVGKFASPIQYVGPIVAQAPAGRFAPLNRTDAQFERRWVVPQEREIQQLIDTFDELETIIDPKSQYSTNAASAIARAWDDIIISAAFGSASTGSGLADGGGLTAETFNTTTYSIADTFGNGSTTIGMTVEKMIEARRLFRHFHVDLEADPLTMVMGSQQEADLLKLVQVVSTEFNARPVLTDGRLTSFLGWDLVLSERLAVASSIRSCIAFVKSGMYLGIWRDVKSDVDVRKDLSSMPYQLYTHTMVGATRLEKGRVLRIQAGNDASGADPSPL